MTESQWEELQDRLDDIEERLRIMEVQLDLGEDTTYYIDDLDDFDEDDIDILD